MGKYDVCIFGGGPAGSAMAKRLVELGYRVVVIEKAVFPREHVGVSLSPGVEHWLGVLGVSVERVASPRSLLLWERDEVVEKEGGWQVDRGWFDQLLLNASGARVICGNGYPIENEYGEWDVYIEQELLFSARFLVAATGRRPLLKGRRRAILPVTVAAYARGVAGRQSMATSLFQSSFPSGVSSWSTYSPYSSGVRPSAGISSQGMDTFIEAGKSCWYWGGGGLSFVFADPEEVRQFNSVNEFYVHKMKESKLMKATNFGEVMMCTATAYVDESPVGRNFIKIGDAVFTMDPLSAQGVQKALKTAVQGAVVVNTILKGDVSAGVAFYENMIAGEVRKHVRWTRQFYQSQGIYKSSFWERRSGEVLPLGQDQLLKACLDDVLVMNPAAVVALVPVMGRDLIQYEYGVTIPGNDEPFVYVGEKPVAEMVKILDNKTAKEGIRLLGMDIIRWLVYNRILLKAEHQPVMK